MTILYHKNNPVFSFYEILFKHNRDKTIKTSQKILCRYFQKTASKNRIKGITGTTAIKTKLFNKSPFTNDYTKILYPIAFLIVLAS